ncbi:hypothetical protein GGE65_007184 [Skermanella aerolata]
MRNTPFIFQQIYGQYADVDALVASHNGELSCRVA